MAKKKYPEIKPQYIKDINGKVIAVGLPYVVYLSILEEIADLTAQNKINDKALYLKRKREEKEKATKEKAKIQKKATPKKK